MVYVLMPLDLFNEGVRCFGDSIFNHLHNLSSREVSLSVSGAIVNQISSERNVSSGYFGAVTSKGLGNRLILVMVDGGDVPNNVFCHLSMFKGVGSLVIC